MYLLTPKWLWKGGDLDPGSQVRDSRHTASSKRGLRSRENLFLPSMPFSLAGKRKKPKGEKGGKNEKRRENLYEEEEEIK